MHPHSEAQVGLGAWVFIKVPEGSSLGHQTVLGECMSGAAAFPGWLEQTTLQASGGLVVLRGLGC